VLPRKNQVGKGASYSAEYGDALILRITTCRGKFILSFLAVAGHAHHAKYNEKCQVKSQ
jgi:hypothetical protein